MTVVAAHRIQVLPTRLANQIAAGEVVERPASVIKELLENSLDAGATRIDIELEQAGVRRMTLTDNGSGIHRDDLALALARHATSKIHSIDDLAAISSLGFRGEALASIASIARLQLISRTAEADSAWSAFADGADMAVKLQPAALNKGTRVDVSDLFYNTPARRRFLRSENTELWHIEEVIKRAALAAPQCAFHLKHNGKTWKQWRVADSSATRVKQILGDSFMLSALALDQQVEHVRIHGFVAPSSAHRAQTDQQFVFVNGRSIRDRVVQHALRAGFGNQIPDGRAPAYVIFIDMPVSDVDVNVHPTKHEVRFRHARWMHDLLTASVVQTVGSDTVLPLAHNMALSTDTPPRHIAESAATYQLANEFQRPVSALETRVSTHSRYLRLNDEFALLLLNNHWHLTQLNALLTVWLQQQLNMSSRRPLLFVQRLPNNVNTQDMIQRLNGQASVQEFVVLHAAPLCLADCDWPLLAQQWRRDEAVESQIASHLLSRLSPDGKTMTQLLQWLDAQSGLVLLPLRALDQAALSAWWQSR